MLLTVNSENSAVDQLLFHPVVREDESKGVYILGSFHQMALLPLYPERSSKSIHVPLPFKIRQMVTLILIVDKPV